MSSILDALERASKERENKQGQKISSDALGRHSAADRQSAIEKQLRTENEKQKKLVIWMVVIFGVVVIGAVAAMGFIMMARADRDAAERESNRVAAAEPAKAGATLEEIIPVLKSGLEAPGKAAPADAIPTPAPTEAPSPVPTVAASPTGVPSPKAEPTAASYIQNSKEADVTSYKGVFTDGQIIRPAEVGWSVEGVMEMKSGNIAIINGKQVKAGQKIGELHITEVRSGLITVDVGDGTIVKVRF
ncbi:hypothetical protein IT570_01480 [Candidatus Sumerlaeota bacterium]|nr:hypothetical protein [Candidatus Sumerlaeota bacterium]